MIFQLPNNKFPWRDSRGQQLELQLDNLQEVEYAGKTLLYVRLRMFGDAESVEVHGDILDPRKTYRLIPGYRLAEWFEKKTGRYTDVLTVDPSDRDDITQLLLKQNVVKEKDELIFWG